MKASPAYVITGDGFLAARIVTALPAGAVVRVGFQRCAEAIDANRKWNLVNANWAKISRAKKWAKVPAFDYDAEEIAPGVLYLTLSADILTELS